MQLVKVHRINRRDVVLHVETFDLAGRGEKRVNLRDNFVHNLVWVVMILYHSKLKKASIISQKSEDPRNIQEPSQPTTYAMKKSLLNDECLNGTLMNLYGQDSVHNIHTRAHECEVSCYNEAFFFCIRAIVHCVYLGLTRTL